MKEKTIKALYVEPGKTPRMIEMPNTLEAKQKAVGGWIEATYPFDDNVAVICNEEGKLNGMEYNRMLKDEKGKIYDVIAGPFLIVGADPDDEDFGSLPADLAKKYKQRFKNPEFYERDPETGRMHVTIMEIQDMPDTPKFGSKLPSQSDLNKGFRR